MLQREKLGPLDATLDDAQLASALVRNAAELALIMRQQGLTGERKTSVSDVVTAADKAAEEYLVEQLRRARPSDSILAEEGSSYQGTSDRTWVIDPIDGTYNFLSGSSYWCSAIALQQNSGRQLAVAELDPEVLLGAVYQVEEHKLWIGGRGLPSTLNGQRLAAPAELPLSQLSAGTYLHPSLLSKAEAREPWLSAVEQLATFRLLGSGSCDLSRVAEQQLGCWFQHSAPLWDWLPGKAIVRAAGGSTAVVQVNGLNWFLAGAQRAVQELSAALSARAVEADT